MGQGSLGPQTSDDFSVIQKTDFRTNWPTPQVVIMQKRRSASGGFATPGSCRTLNNTT